MVISKDIKYMKLCAAIANIFSTCSKRKYGAILVDELDHVVGFGYNGGPRNSIHCDDGGCPRVAQNSPNGSNYDNCIAIHAEANAILHSDYSAKPKKIYVNGPPCFGCAKLICNSTVTDVYYVEDSNYLEWDRVNKFLNDHQVKTWKVEYASV